jgi:hypothetical protein
MIQWPPGLHSTAQSDEGEGAVIICSTHSDQYGDQSEIDRED